MFLLRAKYPSPTYIVQTQSPAAQELAAHIHCTLMVSRSAPVVEHGQLVVVEHGKVVVVCTEEPNPHVN